MDAKTASFILRASRLHNSKYDYSKSVYQTWESKVVIICNEHGEFLQSAGGHLSGQGCNACGNIRNRRTISNEDYIKSCKEIHGDRYDYTEVRYTGKDNKVRIICRTHGIFEQCANSHKRGSGCRQCSIKHRGSNTKWTTKTFIEACKEVHGNTYTYNNTIYTKGNERIAIECRVHGEFNQIARNHLNLKHGCPRCGLEATTSKQRFSIDTFIKNARAVHGEKYNYSKVEYINCSTKVTITCPIHGDFMQTPHDHVNRKCQCQKCSNSYKPTNEEFADNARYVHGEKYDYSQVGYVNCDTTVSIICPLHGTFEQTPYNHVNLKCGCPKCSRIGYSKAQIEWLTFLETYYNIDIQHIGNSPSEFRIQSTNWRADGYCKETNTIYEYHGSYYHGDPRLYEPNVVNGVNKRTMGELYANTILRESKIKELGYNLVVIWDYDWLRWMKAIKRLQMRFRKSREIDSITKRMALL